MKLPIKKSVETVANMSGFVYIVDANGDHWFEGTGEGTEGSAADLIVTAVNSHEALLSTIKVARNWIVRLAHTCNQLGKAKYIIDAVDMAVTQAETGSDTISVPILDSLRLDIMRTALIEIAMYDDDYGNNHLRISGAYSGFDDPGSVETAREALEAVGYRHGS